MKNFDPDNSAVACGGKNIYAASLGILMLESRFPRIPGDVGNASTWDFPVHYKVVKGASPDKVVRRGAEGLLEAFISAGQELIDMGVDGISTNCGFMTLLQAEMSQALSVPVAASSLMQVPMVQATLPPGKRVGIITISESTLSDAHLASANLPLDTPVIGTDAGEEFTRAILDDEPYLDTVQSERDIIAAGKTLLDRHPEVGSVVLECTNMVPYAAALQRELALPVYSIYNLLCWFQAGLTPKTFARNFR